MTFLQFKHQYLKSYTVANRWSEGLKYTLSDDETYYIVSGMGTCTDTDIVIPSRYESKPVKAIGNSAFKNCTSFVSIFIPKSIIRIEDSAFSYCTNLEIVNFEKNSKLESINYGAFYYCNLISIEIPNGVTSIGNVAFYMCSGLVEVINKSSLNITKGSEDYGYVACYALEVHSGESKIVNIDDYLFFAHEGANYLMGYIGNDTTLVLPESYNGENYEIYHNAFYGCDSVTSIIIPNSVTNINASFSGCNLSSYSVYDNAKYIGNAENPYLVLIAATSKTITSCVIHEDAKLIAGSAFFFCSSLESVTVPISVTAIGSGAFALCSNFNKIYYAGSEEEWEKISIYDDTILSKPWMHFYFNS